MSVFISELYNLNFYKYNTALSLYKIFINEPLLRFAVSFKCWSVWTRLWAVAYESVKTKEKSGWVISKVIMVAHRSGRLRAFKYKV